jgi:hypothetical protein
VKTAFVLLILPFAQLAAQDSATASQEPRQIQEHAFRDPHKAQVLATIVPGAGYAYTGEYLRGYGTWVMTFIGVTVGPIIFSDDTCGFIFVTTCSKSDRTANMLAGSLITVSGVWTYVSSIRDARKSAERANERHRRREFELHPTIGVPESRHGLNAGLSVAW